MALAPGASVGPYEVTALLGEGGMGKVWRAHHTALKRDDALKVLPDAFATDPERLARFQREAQVLASLNHPNIAHVYGLEDVDGVKALVMELVEGPTLDDRIRQGPIPVDEAMPIARQVAEALEAAHEQGIVHRDLKPANIKVRPDGTVKVLDFGLAKALEPSVSTSGLSQAPTLTSPAMTQQGVILGTAAYMSPEQAKGRAVDRRTDVWAFGAVLYEMLTGRRAFTGSEVSEVLASVLAREPDWALLPPTLSPTLATYIKRCLQKDPRQRIGDVQSLRLALEGAFESGQSQKEPVAAAQAAWWRPVPVALAASLATAVVVGFAGWSLSTSSEPPMVTRFNHDLSDGVTFSNTGWAVMALSPDGRHFVYNTNEGLFLRSMGDLEPRLIPGTEGGLANPFFSPDGASVGYFQPDGLKRIAITGGAPVVIATGIAGAFGASWASDDTIFFGAPEGIMRVSANGGTPELVIPKQEGEFFYGPQLLPDGESVLFSVTTSTDANRWDQAAIVVQSLRTGERTVVLRGGTEARYLSTGHLVYALEDGLFAVAFNLDRLEVQGGPVSLVEGVMRTSNALTGAANYSVSDQGTLVYVSGASGFPEHALVWVDRDGREEPVSAAPVRNYNALRISPDGTRVAVDIRERDNNIWMWDFGRETLTRLTFTSGGGDFSAVWFPDSERVVLTSNRDGPGSLYRQAADGTGTVERLTESETNQVASAITPDGNKVIFRQGGAQPDIMQLSLEPSGEPEPLVQTMFGERFPALSPNGRWLAYESNESGQYEVYVRPFPDVESGRWQVSTTGGQKSVWSRNGEELFYVSPESMLMGVRVEPGPSWRSSTPTRIFQGEFFWNLGGANPTYDIASDGRFLVIKETGETAGSLRINVVMNWFEELRQRVPVN